MSIERFFGFYLVLLLIHGHDRVFFTQLLEKLARWGLVKEPPAFWVCISLVTRIFIAPPPQRLDSAAPPVQTKTALLSWSAATDEVIKNFYKKVEKSTWQNLIDVQQDYRDAEAVGSFTVFNIKGNRYRLILDIDYEEQVAYFKYFLTHAEYDKEQWKDDPYY